jgi:hypothetical protein
MKSNPAKYLLGKLENRRAMQWLGHFSQPLLAPLSRARSAPMDALHQIILAQAAEAEAREAELAAAKAGLLAKALEIEKYKLQIARLRRMQFGRSSEKIARTIEQLELKLEELEAGLPATSGDTSAAPGEPSRRSINHCRIGRSPNAGRCPLIFRLATLSMNRTATAPSAAARCARSARTSPAFSITSPAISRWFGTSARRSRAGAARAE